MIVTPLKFLVVVLLALLVIGCAYYFELKRRYRDIRGVPLSRAFETMEQLGGGTVYFPPGEYDGMNVRVTQTGRHDWVALPKETLQ